MKIYVDERLSAARLTINEFVGQIEIKGDVIMPDMLFDLYQDRNVWGHLPELPLLQPQAGYSLRCRIPALWHEIFLIYENAVVGFFVETDSLAVLSNHQGKGLGCELILAAFAQKKWCLPPRKVSPAGQTAFQRSYNLACELT